MSKKLTEDQVGKSYYRVAIRGLNKEAKLDFGPVTINGRPVEDVYNDAVDGTTNRVMRNVNNSIPRLVETGAEAVKKQIPGVTNAVKAELPGVITATKDEVNKHMPEMVNNATTAAINSATTGDNKKKLDELGRSVGDNAMSGALNNKQLQQWMFRAGGGLAGALLLSSFMKNKSLAWLLGLVGGGLAGNYVHSNWKGGWGKTWDSMKSRWGSK